MAKGLEAIRTFGLYVPKELVRRIVDAGQFTGRSAQRQDVTSMFTDIFDFTTISERHSPEEVVEKIKSDLEPAGVNHMIFSLADPALVKLFSGEDVPNVPDVNGQLKLVAERVMPAFG